MSKKVNAAMSDKSHNHTDDSFVQRWSQRKLQQQSKQAIQSPPPEALPLQPTSEPVREEDLPPIESLHEDSEVSMFLGEGVSENLRRQALRRLFHFGKFNVCDGLDDYAEDYNIFEPLPALFDTHQQLDHIAKKTFEAEEQPKPSHHAVNPQTQANEQVPEHSASEHLDEPETEKG